MAVCTQAGEGHCTPLVAHAAEGRSCSLFRLPQQVPIQSLRLRRRLHRSLWFKICIAFRQITSAQACLQSDTLVGGLADTCKRKQWWGRWGTPERVARDPDCSLFGRRSRLRRLGPALDDLWAQLPGVGKPHTRSDHSHACTSSAHATSTCNGSNCISESSMSIPMHTHCANMGPSTASIAKGVATKDLAFHVCMASL